ncbi:MAG: cell division protein FtsW [Anaerolineae bacterium]|nr:cell division protein FtsW [Anaerolineae bacterium]
MAKKGSRNGRERRAPDYLLILIVAALLLIGLLMVYSTTFDWGNQVMGDSFYHVKRQVLWTVLGVAIAVALAYVQYNRLRDLAVPIMGITLGVLVLLLAIGEQHLGARRSFLGGSVQPGELAKLTTLIYVSAWVSSKGEQIRDVAYGFVPFAVLVGVVSGLVMLQPDLSTAAVIMLTSFAVFFLAGADLVQIMVGSAAGGGAFSLLVMFYPYARQRLEEFISMLRNPEMMSYHARESLIALGSGGVFGKGFGMSYQKFGYLPVPHTDSIFSIIGEELGLVGCLVVVALFVVLAWRGFRIALRAQDSFGMVLACGLTVLLVSQALINVGVVTGLLPFTGMVLPFISLGGSSLLVSMAAVGILLSISRGGNPREWRVSADLDRWRWDGGTRLSRSGRPSGS